MMRTTVARLLLAAFLAVSFAPAADAQGTTPAGDPVKGKATFMAENCYLCHGTFGQGGGRAGPKLAPHPIRQTWSCGNYVIQPRTSALHDGRVE